MAHRNDLSARSNLQDTGQLSVDSRLYSNAMNSRAAKRRLLLSHSLSLFVVMFPLLLLLAACASSTPTPAPAATATPPAIAVPTPSQDWPPILTPTDNPTTPATVELGRQLFYDPILSMTKAMSCATCHHPDLGFSNGKQVSTPRPGAPARNVSALWNTGYNRFLLWDGREESLESQARLPLTLPNEMAMTPADVETRLAAIPAYVALFVKAFGNGSADPVTFDNATRALAAFQRTLISNNSAYDRYVAGDASALTPEQQRGMEIFFSAKTQCAECHRPPTLSIENFRVVGVPSDDPGRAGVTEKGIAGAFKPPTLRNVALSGPYMHNGSLATLDDVVQFYAGGAGRANGFARVDPLLKGFDLTAEEQADLVAFLKALTDESQLPMVPDVVLSGLPVVERIRK